MPKRLFQMTCTTSEYRYILTALPAPVASLACPHTARSYSDTRLEGSIVVVAVLTCPDLAPTADAADRGDATESRAVDTAILAATAALLEVVL